MAFTLKETTEPRPHQIESVDFFLKCQGSIGLFDEPGLGKTLEILMMICEVVMPWEKALIVCPSYLKLNWIHEIETFTNMKLKTEIDVLTYYEFTNKIDSISDYSFVGFDEAHALKNTESQRGSQAQFLLHTQTPQYFVYATGTPITNRVIDIYAFLALLSNFPHVNPNIMDKYSSMYAFAMNFCNVTEKTIGGRNIMQFKGLKNKEELRTYLDPWTLRRKTDDVLKDVPEMQLSNVIASYKKDSKLEEEWQNHKDKSQVSKGIEAKVSSAKAKVGFTVDYVSDLLETGNGPIVVGSDHREPAQEIYDRLVKKGYRCTLVMGGQGIEKRNEKVKMLQNGETDVYIATFKSSYEGVTLTKARYVVCNDIPWEPAILEQFLRRVRRMTQTKTSFGIFVIGSVIDEMITRDIRSKIKAIKNTLGDYDV